MTYPAFHSKFRLNTLLILLDIAFVDGAHLAEGQKQRKISGFPSWQTKTSSVQSEGQYITNHVTLPKDRGQIV